MLLPVVALRRSSLLCRSFSLLFCLLLASAAPLSAQTVDPQTPDVPAAGIELAQAGVVDDWSQVKLEGVVRPKEARLNKTALKLAAAGLVLIPFDKRLASGFDPTPSGHKSDSFTETANLFGDRNLLLAGLGGMYLLGSKSSKDTAKTALSALVMSGSMTEGLKFITGRGRPSAALDPGVFMGPGADDRASFPSGHTSAAFAVATVMANKKPKHKWLYYGLATAVGVARIKKSAHFPSDVLVGAGVGVYSGRRALSGGVNIYPFKFSF